MFICCFWVPEGMYEELNVLSSQFCDPASEARDVECDVRTREANEIAEVSK